MERAESGGWQTVWVGLGSNAADAMVRLERARAALDMMEGLRVARASSVYRTEPQDYADQPWFHNQVLRCLAAPRREPVSLMRDLLAAEARLGRVRSPDPALRFGPRAIDIDILLWGEDAEVRCSDPVCLVPHPRLTRRAFWLVPLRDMAPALAIQGESLDVHLGRLAWTMKDNVIYQEQPGPAGDKVPGRTAS